jgi:hypothetical protein
MGTSLCTYCNFTKYRSGREDVPRLVAAYARALDRALDDLVSWARRTLCGAAARACGSRGGVPTS